MTTTTEPVVETATTTEPDVPEWAAKRQTVTWPATLERKTGSVYAESGGNLASSSTKSFRWFTKTGNNAAAGPLEHILLGACCRCTHHTHVRGNGTTSGIVLTAGYVVEDEKGRPIVFCANCWSGNLLSYANSADDQFMMVNWPQHILDAGMVPPVTVGQPSIVPAVEPRRGCFLRVKASGAMVRFSEWSGPDLLDRDGKTHKVGDVEVLTTAHSGTRYNRAVTIPHAEGEASDVHSIVGWSGTTLLTLTNGRAGSQKMGTLAALAPVLNPARETSKAKAERLERERQQIMTSLRNALVSQGIARDWCQELDPLVVAYGMAPRVKKNVITFLVAIDYQIGETDNPETTIEAVRNQPRSYLSVTSQTKVVDARYDRDDEFSSLPPLA